MEEIMETWAYAFRSARPAHKWDVAGRDCGCEFEIQVTL